MKRSKKKDFLVRSIKRDVKEHERVTLIALSLADLDDYAQRFTTAELRKIWFTIPGLCLAPRAHRHRTARRTSDRPPDP